MPEIRLRCFHCGSENSYMDRVGIRADCEKCHSDAHVCKNCSFYDPKVYNECREPQADVIREKDRSNMCDFFQPSGSAGGSCKSKEDLLKAAEALFKKK